MTTVAPPAKSSQELLEEGLAGIGKQEETPLPQSGKSFDPVASNEPVLHGCLQANFEATRGVLNDALLKRQTLMTPAPDGKKDTGIAEAIENMALEDTSQEFVDLVELAVWRVLGFIQIVVLVAVWLLINAFSCMTFLGHEAMLPDNGIAGTNRVRGNFATFSQSVRSLLHVFALRDWPELVHPLVEHAPATLVLTICHAAVTAAMLLGVWLLIMRGSGEVLEAGSSYPRRRPGAESKSARRSRFGLKRQAGSGGWARLGPPVRSARPGSGKPGVALSGSGRPNLPSRLAHFGSTKQGLASAGSARPSLPARQAQPGLGRPAVALPGHGKYRSNTFGAANVGPSQPRRLAPTQPGGTWGRRTVTA